MYKAFNQETNDIVVYKHSEDPRQGITSIHMNLMYDSGIRMGKTTIYRYMRINGISSITRTKKRKYTKVSFSPKNHIKGDFEADAPNEKWSIDISEFYTGEGKQYICAIKDMYDKSIVAYTVSDFQDGNLVMETVHCALEKVKSNQRQKLILHSDQGSQFKMKRYRDLLKHNNIKHSMSTKGSSVENAPIESWFSAFKSETLHLDRFRSKQEAKDRINEYVYFYNFKRLQEKIGGLPPVEYRYLHL